MVHFIEDEGDPARPAAGGVAPVIPLFAGQPGITPTRATDGGGGAAAADEEAADVDAAREDEAARARELAEKHLLKKLRTRQLSVSEARAALAAGDLPSDEAERIIDEQLRRGYLDDARLAEQLAYSGVEKKGHGRRAIAQTMARRGVSREAADAALALLPDDEAERALEYARAKAPSLSRAAPEAALRRLVGQLSRRGYSGPVAMDAAKTALAENGSVMRRL